MTMFSSPLAGQTTQSTIASATSNNIDVSLPPGVPHHPISCPDSLFFDEEGRFGCDHGTMPADDPRTRAALIHSMAMLIIEEAQKFNGIKTEEPDIKDSDED